MKKIYLVRHGETTWNLEGKTQGIKDSQLSKNGLLQAEALGRRLSNENIEIIYSSSLKRARRTSEIIAGILGIPCQFNHQLIEMNFGLWEGLTIEEIGKNYPTELRRWRETPHEANIPEGESIINAQKRIVSYINGVILSSKENNILVVSHSTVIKLYLLHILNMDLSDYYRLKQENCCMNIIEYKCYGPVLVKYNDTSHMDIMIDSRGCTE